MAKTSTQCRQQQPSRPRAGRRDPASGLPTPAAVFSSSSAHIQRCQLSVDQQHLISLMQRINFGRIEGLLVRRGQPVLAPPPRIIREIKFGADNGPRPEAGKADFTLKAQVREMFAQLEALGDGVIPCIEVQRGLPFRMTVEEVCA